MRLLSTALAAAAALLSFAATASAETITCPLTQARRTVTNELPNGWWTTPIVNNLTETKIQDIGGKPALMCVYGPSGSVQRDAPMNSKCVAKAKGFECSTQGVVMPPVNAGAVGKAPVNVNAAAKPVVTSGQTGTLSVPQTYSFDLDKGTIGSSAGADIWFEAETAQALYLSPRNGARMWVGNRANRGKDGCAAGTQYSGARVALSDLPIGSYVCVRTSENKVSQFRMNALSGGSPKTLTLGFTTFD
jgi:hypothetical protein